MAPRVDCGVLVLLETIILFYPVFNPVIFFQSQYLAVLSVKCSKCFSQNYVLRFKSAVFVLLLSDTVFLFFNFSRILMLNYFSLRQWCKFYQIISIKSVSIKILIKSATV